jgi:hypothetical protein
MVSFAFRPPFTPEKKVFAIYRVRRGVEPMALINIQAAVSYQALVGGLIAR